VIFLGNNVNYLNGITLKNATMKLKKLIALKMLIIFLYNVVKSSIKKGDIENADNLLQCIKKKKKG
jgi:hypothetical protein